MKKKFGALLGSFAIALQCSVAQGAIMATGFPSRPAPPPGAPNVLIIMTDDVGYGASSTFGGAIPTPTFDALAKDGLRYGNFHTTALCAPTRAALLTGRNHHAVGFGTVPELAHGEPGYDSIIPKSAGTIGQILSAAGYDTAWFGKNHNIPTWQGGPLGPFDQWANGLGFGYFYGFNGGLTDQFAPALIENDRMIEPPHQSGYILDRDLADHAISWLRMQHVQGGGRPFLLYYAPGTAHAPIQAPANWIAKFRGKFDAGWDAYRLQTFERQKAMGLVPADAKLPPLPSNINPWDKLSADQKRVAARYMEVYAAALSYCDNQIGRVIDELRQSGELDNTLVIYIQGDNGASSEGGANGALDYVSRMNGNVTAEQELAHSLKHLDEIGGPRSFPVAPAGWGVSMDTPFPYFKTVASRLGGVTNGMVVSWPAKIHIPGLRSQFVDATDIAPTVLAAAGIAPPAQIDGIAQQPFDGVSFAASFEKPDAPSLHSEQYFEMMGHAAIYQDGWFAASRVIDGPQAGLAIPAIKAPWQLYDLNTDHTQTDDVSSQYPDKLAALRAVFNAEAERNHVFPLLSITENLKALLPQSRPEILASAGRYTFYPSAYRYPDGTFPNIDNRSWSIDADLEVPAGPGDGVVVTQGGEFGGWGLVVLKGVPTFLYRADDRAASLFRVAPPRPLAPGRHHVIVRFAVDGPGLGQGGAYVMEVDGKDVASAHLAHSVPFGFMPAGAAIGHDTGTPLSDDYRVPFDYAGTLNSLTIDLDPVRLPQAVPIPAHSDPND